MPAPFTSGQILCVALPDETLELMDSLCEETESTRNDIILSAIDEFLKRYILRLMIKKRVNETMSQLRHEYEIPLPKEFQ